MQAALVPLAAQKESSSLLSAYVIEAWSNPNAWSNANAAVDKKGNTPLHMCESPKVMAFLLEHPDIEVNVINKVRYKCSATCAWIFCFIS